MPRDWRCGGSGVGVTDAIWKPHTTVAAHCERDGRYLLVREEIDGAIVFNQPAGHLDPDESLLDAVVRETLEETRYLFTPTALQGIYRYSLPAGSMTFVRFLFRGEAGERVAGELDQGIISAEWMSYTDVLDCREQHRTPMVLQCIDDAREHPGYPLDVISQRFA